MIYIKNNRETQTVYIPRTELNSEALVVVSNTYEDGYREGKKEGQNIQKSKMTSLVVSDNGLYERGDGWNKVEVNVAGGEFKAQAKTVTVSMEKEDVYPDKGYNGLSAVHIDAVQFKEEAYNDGYDHGYEEGKAGGGEFKTQEKTLIVTSATQTVVPDGGYDALTKVVVNATQYGENRRNEGYANGYGVGKDDGYASGKEEGYNEGYEAGKSESKIKILDYDVNIQRSTFTAIPDWMDFEGATSLNQTFMSCQYLKSADLPNISSVESLNSTFSGCYDLESVLLETSNVTNMQSTFSECHALSSVTLTDTSNVKNMSNMFYECWNLRSIPMMNTSEVTSMYKMFYDCGKLTTIPELNTSKVKNMNGMFAGCTGLTSLPEIDATNATDLSYFFGGEEVTNLTSFGGFKNLKTSIADDYCLAKAPNLDLQSLANIASKVYNFTANGETPATGQGVLKLHPDVYNKIAYLIGAITSKGWTIIS